MEVSLNKLLKGAAEAGTSVKVGTVVKRTRSDFGFTVRFVGDAVTFTGAGSCYLHTGPKHKELSEGDKLILSVSPSTKVGDRLDVTAYTRYPGDIVKEISALENAQLASILPVISSEFSTSDWTILWDVWLSNPQLLLELSKSLTNPWLSKITQHCPTQFRFKILEVIKPISDYVWKLTIGDYIAASGDDRRRLLGFLERYPEIRAELAQTNLLNKNPVASINRKIREQSLEVESVQYEIDVGPEHIDSDHLFHLLSNESGKFDTDIWVELWQSFVCRPEITTSLQEQLEPLVWKRAVQAQPVEFLPVFLPYIEPSIDKLGLYLLGYYENDPSDLKATIRAFIENREGLKAQLTLMSLSEIDYPADLGLSLAKLSASDFVSGLTGLSDRISDIAWIAIWREWETRPQLLVFAVKRDLPPDLWSKAKKSRPDGLLPNLIDLIEPNAEEIWSYVIGDHVNISSSDAKNIKEYIDRNENIRTSLASLQIEPSNLPKALNYFVPGENVFWVFVTEHWKLIGEEVRGLVRAAINDADYVQARFLLYLTDRGTQRGDYPLHLLAKDVEKLVDNLFDMHSLQQSRIDRTIFMDCPVKIQFSACEVSIATNRQAGEPDAYSGGIQPSLKYWCRRAPCDSGECLVNHEGLDNRELLHRLPVTGRAFLAKNGFGVGGYFYQLAKENWGYTKANLHHEKNGVFIRPLAAINRWNEVVERLHCYTCKAPLRISEHSPNSINKMAYSVTYWHCADKHCSEYARSVKLSHCQGSRCDKIIDSREDRHACNPWEIRSYKKMYFCSKCGSCCPTHAKRPGGYTICPACGRDDGYTVPPDASGRMQCTNCDHQIVIPWDKRKSVQERFQMPRSPQDTIVIENEDTSSLFLLPRQYLEDGAPGVFSIHFNDDKPRLYVYDLFSCLKSGFVRNLSKYEKIYDIRLIEKLYYLGQFHRRYNDGEPESFGLLNHLKAISSQSELDQFGSRISGYIGNLLEKAESKGVLDHYEKIEQPFTLALVALLGVGFHIDREALTSLIDEIELARNRTVESLRLIGIDTPTRESLRAWLPYSDSDMDTAMLLNSIDHIDFKSIRHIDPIFEAFYRVEKLERMGGSIKGIYGLTGNILPDYQVVGTDTLRCTSQRPNLLGFPKQLRPLVKAASSKCIIDCDYRQMEVGVMAALAGDQVLISDYNSGDVYSALGLELGISRDRAKLVFLGILYGVSNRTLQIWLAKKETEVDMLLHYMFTRYERLKTYQDEQVRQGESLGYVEAVTGIRRSVSRRQLGHAGNTESIRIWQKNWFKNYPVQASSTVVFKRAIIEVAENVEPREFKLIAPLYDAIVFEVPVNKKIYYTDLVVSAMKRAMTTYFPMLKPQVSVNDYDVTCWNGGEGSLEIRDFFLDAEMA